MQWLLVVLLLTCVAGGRGNLMKVYPVRKPVFDAEFGDHFEFRQEEKALNAYRNASDQHVTYNDTFIYAMHFPFDGNSQRFTSEQLEEVKREYPKLTGNWSAFHGRYQISHLLYINGSQTDLLRVLTMRRLYIRRSSLKNSKGIEYFEKHGIDYMDEMNTYDRCYELRDGKYYGMDGLDTIRHFDERLDLINGKYHYFRINYGCKIEGFKYCDDMSDALDDKQAWPVKALENIRMRLGRLFFDREESWVNVKQWRLFDSCNHVTEQTENPYPYIQKRLNDLGFSDELLDAVSTREQRLALRLFSQPALAVWRRELANYKPEVVLKLEHMDRQWWKKKYEENDPNDALFKK